MKDELAGKRIKCTYCSEILTVEAASAVPVTEQAAAPEAAVRPARRPPPRPRAAASSGGGGGWIGFILLIGIVNLLSYLFDWLFWVY